MAIAIKRYKDGSYTPLFKPLSRRMDYGTPEGRKMAEMKDKESAKNAKIKRMKEREEKDLPRYRKYIRGY